MTFELFSAIAASSFLIAALPLTRMYSGAKSCSMSIAMRLFGRSRMCPTLARTVYPGPRILVSVFDFVGDSTMTSTDPGRDFPPVAVVPVFVFADGFFAGIDPASFTAGFVVVFVVAGFFRAAGLFFFSVAAADSSPDCFGDVVFFAAIR